MKIFKKGIFRCATMLTMTLIATVFFSTTVFAGRECPDSSGTPWSNSRYVGNIFFARGGEGFLYNLWHPNNTNLFAFSYTQLWGEPPITESLRILKNNNAGYDLKWTSPANGTQSSDGISITVTGTGDNRIPGSDAFGTHKSLANITLSANASTLPGTSVNNSNNQLKFTTTEGWMCSDETYFRDQDFGWFISTSLSITAYTPPPANIYATTVGGPFNDYAWQVQTPETRWTNKNVQISIAKNETAEGSIGNPPRTKEYRINNGPWQRNDGLTLTASGTYHIETRQGYPVAGTYQPSGGFYENGYAWTHPNNYNRLTVYIDKDAPPVPAFEEQLPNGSTVSPSDKITHSQKTQASAGGPTDVRRYINGEVNLRPTQATRTDAHPLGGHSSNCTADNYNPYCTICSVSELQYTKCTVTGSSNKAQSTQNGDYYLKSGQYLNLVATANTTETFRVTCKNVDWATNESQNTSTHYYEVNGWREGITPQYRWSTTVDRLLGTYSSYTTLTPITNNDYPSYSSADKVNWNIYHHSQRSEEYRNPYGDWYERNKTEINNLWNTYKRIVSFYNEVNGLPTGGSGDTVVPPTAGESWTQGQTPVLPNGQQTWEFLAQVCVDPGHSGSQVCRQYTEGNYGAAFQNAWHRLFGEAADILSDKKITVDNPKNDYSYYNYNEQYIESKKTDITIDKDNLIGFERGWAYTVTEWRRFLTIDAPIRQEQSRFYYWRDYYVPNTPSSVPSTAPYEEQIAYNGSNCPAGFALGTRKDGTRVCTRTVQANPNGWTRMHYSGWTTLNGQSVEFKADRFSEKNGLTWDNWYAGGFNGDGWNNHLSEDVNGKVNVTLTSPIEYKSWQMLNVHCNKEGYDALLKAFPAGTFTDKSIGTGALKGKTTATLTTREYYHIEPLNKPGQQNVHKVELMSELPFGNASLPANTGNTASMIAAAKATSRTSFFTDGTSCNDVIKCVATPIKDAANNSGDNKGSAGLTDEGKFGAQDITTNLSGNIFTHYRDARRRVQRADIWYPNFITNGNVGLNVTPEPGKDNGSKYDPTIRATGTQVVFDTAGTPKENLFLIEMGSILSQTASTSKYFLSGGKLTTSPKNYYSGQFNFFTTRAKWASDKDKPHRWNVRWRYVIQMPNKVWGTINGKDGGTNEEITYRDMDVYCNMTVNTNATQEAIIDNSLLDYGSYVPTWNFDKNKAIGAYFIRAVGE